MTRSQTTVDISMPICNGMWAYKEAWENRIAEIQSNPSTVYRFDLCSHTGTYIQTCEHKLERTVSLDSYDLSDFTRACKTVVLPALDEQKCVTRGMFEEALDSSGLILEQDDSVLIATGWGVQNQRSDFIEAAPYFDEPLVELLCEFKLAFLAVDTPVIENTNAPYGAVERLFLSNERLLMLAPVAVDTRDIESGVYTVSALPLNIPGVCASPCRAVLTDLR